jgi:hypothetical protein
MACSTLLGLLNPENRMRISDPKKSKTTPYAHPFRIAHWMLAAGTAFLILTGFGIHSVSMPSWSVPGRYPFFYPTFRSIYWHRIAGIFVAPASVVALICFLQRSSGTRISGLRKITNLLLSFSTVVCSITSLGLIYTDIPPFLYHLSRFLHAVCGMIVAPLSLLAHSLLAFFRYFRLLAPSFAPLRQGRWIKVLWLAAGCVVSWGVLTRYIPRHAGMNRLVAAKISMKISDARQCATLPWEKAASLEIRLVNGAGFDFGETRAVLRALYNDTHIFFRIQWDDPVYNRLYRPWIKTDGGWMHLNPGGSDEKVYNEDKMAILFPLEKDPDFEKYGCSIYCHNDAESGFGKHWTPGERIVDVWHWKSVRTDPLGYADDKYWQGLGKLAAGSQGRHGDPGTEGYLNNVVDGISNPVMLPTGIDSILMGALLQTKAEIYTKAAAGKFPEGSAVPGVIIYEATGDRADIRCRSTYNKGAWTVWMMRKLDTGSRYDVIFEPGKEYDFAMTAFDHSSFRHAYNQQAYCLVFTK